MKYDLLVENWNNFLKEEDTSSTSASTVQTASTVTLPKDVPQTEEEKKQAKIKSIKDLAQKYTNALKNLSKQLGIDYSSMSPDITSMAQNTAITEEKKKGDRCTRIAKRKYKVWPSAYASGAVVKCRQGKIWKGISENATDEEIDSELLLEEIELIEEAKKKDYKPNFSKEKKQGLHGWFARNKGKGWVNCRTGGPCGRDSADSGGKYPACRPTKAQCKSAGKGPLRKKKSSKSISWTKEK